jgi:hypothetical protein
MNIFVLSTGRSGTVSFSKACNHIENFSSGHESNWRRIGKERLMYPSDHIEADNRLSWLLGRLDETYGKDAFYVHLIREKEATAHSFKKRYNHERSILRAYMHGILGFHPDDVKEKMILETAKDYWETVNANIRSFLKDKPTQMTIHLESIKDSFPEFWEAIGARGNLSETLMEFDVKHNASQNKNRATSLSNIKSRLAKKIKPL